MNTHDIRLRPTIIRELAEREHGAASIGGPTWKAFVDEAELRLGEPWDDIRQLLDSYHRQHRTYGGNPA